MATKYIGHSGTVVYISHSVMLLGSEISPKTIIIKSEPPHRETQTPIHSFSSFHSLLCHFRFEFLIQRMIHFVIKEGTASAFNATL